MDRKEQISDYLYSLYTVLILKFCYLLVLIFLLYKGAHIDSGHHATKAGLAITETLEFENAIKVARDMTSDSDTLIVVTADHSQALIAGGDAGRGADVLGEYQGGKNGTDLKIKVYRL